MGEEGEGRGRTVRREGEEGGALLCSISYNFHATPLF